MATVAAFLALTAAGAQAQAPLGPPSREDAPIAYLLDVTSGQVLFAREADRRFMPASITKAMTTFLAFEWLRDGRLDTRQAIAIKPEVWREWSNVGSTMFLGANDVVTVDDLIHGVTTVSANDGAAVLADGAAGSTEAWVAAMNAKAKAIGMRDSHFGTPNGWMDDGRTFTTARDLGRLGQAMLRGHPGRYRHFVGHPTYTYNGITQPNHDPLSGKVAGADGIKTGFTNQAGYGYLGAVRRGKRRLVFVVAASPTSRARERAARQMVNWGFDRFHQRRLFSPGATVAEARVQGGAQLSVPLVAPAGVYITASRSDAIAPRAVIRYRGPVPAPIAKGDAIADLIVTPQVGPSYHVPLVAGEAVGVAGVFARLRNGLAGWTG